MKYKLGQLRRRSIVFLFDVFMISWAWLGAYWLRFNLSTIPTFYLHNALKCLLPVMLVQVCVYLYFGLYRGDWRYASMPDLMRIIKAGFVGTVLNFFALFLTVGLTGVPRSILPLYGLLLIALLGGGRFTYRKIKEQGNLFSDSTRVLVVGAGRAGESIVRDMLRDSDCLYYPVGFVDDKRQRIGEEIHRVRILGKTREIPQLVKKHNVGLIIIALTSANSAKMRRIVKQCSETKVPFRTLPSVKDIADGNISINKVRAVSIDDLLGRSEVALDVEEVNQGLADKKVLITGGGGSIGSEICRQIASLNPAQLIIVESNELNLYNIERELAHSYSHLQFSVCLADVTDEIAVAQFMQQYKPDIIYHAAAYKHVPMLEDQIRAAIRNNIVGTKILAQAAVDAEVSQFVLISTDKVVNPENIMGATKRVAEIYCQNLNKLSNTRFITVRFGNVLDSTGSVIPLFREQINRGGPVTVTHPEVTRYFMTIPEASRLILQATLMGEGGEIFVLDMGEPIKIRDLAEQMIELSGHVVDEDIEINYIGLRPGEKLHEELFHPSEMLMSTAHSKILQARYREVDWKTFIEQFSILVSAVGQLESSNLIEKLLALIPEHRFSRNRTVPNVIEFSKPLEENNP